MKTLLKLFLPTLIPYFVFARYTTLDDGHRQITEQLTEVTLNSLMYYFWQIGVIIYPILFLTQYVIILPIWNRVSGGPLRAALFTLLWVLPASLLLSAGISYVIWDRALSTESLYDSIKTLFGIQGIYWVVNVAILFTIDLIVQLTRKEKKEE